MIKEIHDAFINGKTKNSFSFHYGDGNDSVYIGYRIKHKDVDLFIDTSSGFLNEADYAALRYGKNWLDERNVEYDLNCLTKGEEEDAKLIFDIFRRLASKVRNKVSDLKTIKLGAYHE